MRLHRESAGGDPPTALVNGTTRFPNGDLHELDIVFCNHV
jgi:hypothetical protein